MIDTRLRKEKRIFAEKKKVLAVLNDAKKGLTFAEIAKQLPIKPLRIRGLLIALLKGNDVIHTDNLWIVCTKTTLISSPPVRKQEPLYPDFDEKHEKWQKQILAKKQRFNPFGK